MVYLHLYGQAARNKWRHISASVRTIADATGLSKSAVHAALTHLRRRQLIATTADHVTATPVIAFCVTGGSDHNNCRATAPVARQAMRQPYKFCQSLLAVRILRGVLQAG